MSQKSLLLLLLLPLSLSLCEEVFFSSKIWKKRGGFLDFFLDFFSHYFFQKKRRENDLSISLIKEAKEERDLFSGLIPNNKKKKKKKKKKKRV